MRAKTENKLNEVKKLISDGVTITEACRKANISLSTYQKYKHKTSNVSIEKNKNKSLFMVPIIKDSSKNDELLIAKLQAENAELRRFIKNFL